MSRWAISKVFGFSAMTLTDAEDKAFFQLNLFLTAATMHLHPETFEKQKQAAVAIFASGALEQAWKDQGIEENPDNGHRALLILVNYLINALKLRKDSAEYFVDNLTTWHEDQHWKKLLALGASSFTAFINGNVDGVVTLRDYFE